MADASLFVRWSTTLKTCLEHLGDENTSSREAAAAGITSEYLRLYSLLDEGDFTVITQELISSLYDIVHFTPSKQLGVVAVVARLFEKHDQLCSNSIHNCSIDTLRAILYAILEFPDHQVANSSTSSTQSSSNSEKSMDLTLDEDSSSKSNHSFHMDPLTLQTAANTLVQMAAAHCTLALPQVVERYAKHLSNCSPHSMAALFVLLAAFRDRPWSFSTRPLHSTSTIATNGSSTNSVANQSPPGLSLDNKNHHQHHHQRRFSLPTDSSSTFFSTHQEASNIVVSAPQITQAMQQAINCALDAIRTFLISSGQHTSNITHFPRWSLNIATLHVRDVHHLAMHTMRHLLHVNKSLNWPQTHVLQMFESALNQAPCVPLENRASRIDTIVHQALGALILLVIQIYPDMAKQHYNLLLHFVLCMRDPSGLIPDVISLDPEAFASPETRHLDDWIALLVDPLLVIHTKTLAHIGNRFFSIIHATRRTVELLTPSLMSARQAQLIMSALCHLMISIYELTSSPTSSIDQSLGSETYSPFHHVPIAEYVSVAASVVDCMSLLCTLCNQRQFLAHFRNLMLVLAGKYSVDFAGKSTANDFEHCFFCPLNADLRSALCSLVNALPASMPLVQDYLLDVVRHALQNSHSTIDSNAIHSNFIQLMDLFQDTDQVIRTLEIFPFQLPLLSDASIGGQLYHLLFPGTQKSPSRLTVALTLSHLAKRRPVTGECKGVVRAVISALIRSVILAPCTSRRNLQDSYGATVLQSLKDPSLWPIILSLPDAMDSLLMLVTSSMVISTRLASVALLSSIYNDRNPTYVVYQSSSHRHHLRLPSLSSSLVSSAGAPSPTLKSTAADSSTARSVHMQHSRNSSNPQASALEALENNQLMVMQLLGDRSESRYGDSVLFSRIRDMLHRLLASISCAHPRNVAEDAAVVLTKVLQHMCPQAMIQSYVPRIMKCMSAVLKSTLSDDLHGNLNTATSILGTLGHLVEINPICFESLASEILKSVLCLIADQQSSQRRIAALSFLCRLVRNVNRSSFQPSYQLVDLLLEMTHLLRNEQVRPVRNEALRLLGVIGSIDPQTVRTRRKQLEFLRQSNAAAAAVSTDDALHLREKNASSTSTEDGKAEAGDARLVFATDPFAADSSQHLQKTIALESLANPEEYYPRIVLGQLVAILSERASDRNAPGGAGGSVAGTSSASNSAIINPLHSSAQLNDRHASFALFAITAIFSSLGPSIANLASLVFPTIMSQTANTPTPQLVYLNLKSPSYNISTSANVYEGGGAATSNASTLDAASSLDCVFFINSIAAMVDAIGLHIRPHVADIIQKVVRPIISAFIARGAKNVTGLMAGATASSSIRDQSRMSFSQQQQQHTRHGSSGSSSGQSHPVPTSSTPTTPDRNRSFSIPMESNLFEIAESPNATSNSTESAILRIEVRSAAALGHLMALLTRVLVGERQRDIEDIMVLLIEFCAIRLDLSLAPGCGDHLVLAILECIASMLSYNRDHLHSTLMLIRRLVLVMGDSIYRITHQRSAAGFTKQSDISVASTETNATKEPKSHQDSDSVVRLDAIMVEQMESVASKMEMILVVLVEMCHHMDVGLELGLFVEILSRMQEIIGVDLSLLMSPSAASVNASVFANVHALLVYVRCILQSQHRYGTIVLWTPQFSALSNSAGGDGADEDIEGESNYCLDGQKLLAMASLLDEIRSKSIVRVRQSIFYRAPETSVHQGIVRWKSSSPCRNKDEWAIWLRNLQLDLLQHSSDISLVASAPLARIYPPLAVSLFPPAFASFWRTRTLMTSESEEILMDSQIAANQQALQRQVIEALVAALESTEASSEVMQTLLNLVEYMQREGSPLPIDSRELGQYAMRCHAFAKALHYQEATYRKDPCTETVEALINTNNLLQQPDAAVGVLICAQRKHNMTLEESWYEKLGRWDEALSAYSDRWSLLEESIRRASFNENLASSINISIPTSSDASQQTDPKPSVNTNETLKTTDDQIKDTLLGMFRCWHALGSWQEMEQMASSWWNLLSPSVQLAIAPMAASAAWSVEQWSSMEQYTQMQSSDTLDGSMYRAVLALHHRQWDRVSRHVEVARELLDSELTPMLTEGYSRAYRSVIRVQMLAELEEIVQFRGIISEDPIISSGLVSQTSEATSTAPSMTTTSTSHNQHQQSSGVKALRDRLMKRWSERLDQCQHSVESWQRILKVRSLVLPPSMNYRRWIKLASLCRRSGRMAMSQDILTTLLQPYVIRSDALDQQPSSSNVLRISSTANSPFMMGGNLFDSIGSSMSISYDQLDLNLAEPTIVYAQLKHWWDEAGDGSVQEESTFKSMRHFTRFLTRRLDQQRSVTSTTPAFEDSHGLSIQDERLRLLARCYYKLGTWQRSMDESRQSALKLNGIGINGHSSSRHGSLLAQTRDGRCSPSLLTCDFKDQLYISADYGDVSNDKANDNEDDEDDDEDSLEPDDSFTRLQKASARSQASRSTSTAEEYFLAATSYDKQWSKAWRAWAMTNAQMAMDFWDRGTSATTSTTSSSTAGGDRHSKRNPHLVPAIQGFFRAMALEVNGGAGLLQDSLRLLTLWFKYGGQFPDVNAAFNDGLHTVPVESWLEVIPQLIARIHISNLAVRRLLHQLLAELGRQHPQALVYNLTVASKSQSVSRRTMATALLDKMRSHSAKLVEQAMVVSDELIRVAITWEEMWYDALEEASKAHFQEQNISKMLSILEPLHRLINAAPTSLPIASDTSTTTNAALSMHTPRERAFLEAHGKDLREARELCLRYRREHNAEDLAAAWERYYAVYHRIGKQIPLWTSLDLSQVSPRLHLASNLEVCVPGLHQNSTSSSLVTISCFYHTLGVISSKQRPRRIALLGSDGKTYKFLLKGHEDLRQDERVMQLFSLANVLLASNVETRKRRLCITRFPVIPLSQNTGLIGWLDHCDTLHTLVKDWRDRVHVGLSAEHRMMLHFAPDYENLPLIHKVEAFETALASGDGRDLAQSMWHRAQSAEVWLESRVTFTRSLAVMSMLGYILGLGDRHPSNLLVDRQSGQLIHIDFGDCFEVAMRRDRYPERVPFRLTRMLVQAMESSGVEGSFRRTCEETMKVLRNNRDSMMAVLEAFVHDPLINWRLFANHQAEFVADTGKDLNRSTAAISHESSQHLLSESTIARNNEALMESNKPFPHNFSYIRRAGRGRDIAKMEEESFNRPERANAGALNVISRVHRKLTGRDFTDMSNDSGEMMTHQRESSSTTNHHQLLSTSNNNGGSTLAQDVAWQVDCLIREALSVENLCQSYVGWCAFW